MAAFGRSAGISQSALAGLGRFALGRLARVPSPLNPLLDAIEMKLMDQLFAKFSPGTEESWDMTGWGHPGAPACQSDSATGKMVATGGTAMCGTVLTYNNATTTYGAYRTLTTGSDVVTFLNPVREFTQFGQVYTQGNLKSCWQRISTGVAIPLVPATLAQAVVLVPGYAEPAVAPFNLPQFIPELFPQLDPFTDPNTLPGTPFVDPDYAPLPHWYTPGSAPNPSRSPSEQTKRGYAVPLAETPRDDYAFPFPRPGTAPSYPQPEPWPWRLPPNVTVGSNGSTTSPPQHARKPPNRRDPEKKIRAMGPAASAISKAFQHMTEINDSIDALYEAIPPKDRLKYRPGKPIADWEKARHVAKNWDKVDVAQAMINLVKNQAVDKVIGGLNANAAKIPRITGGLPVGIGYGPGL